MKKVILTITLLLAIGTISAQSRKESIESLKYEVDNLRQQITQIILQNNQSLVEADDALLEAQKRIQALEKANFQLKEQAKSRGNTNQMVGELQANRARIAQLTKQNNGLQAKYLAHQAETRKTTQHFMDRIRRLEAEKTKAANELIELKRQTELSAGPMQYKFKEMESKMVKLEVENGELWKRVETDLHTAYKKNQDQAAELATLKKQHRDITLKYRDIQQQFNTQMMVVRHENEEYRLLKRHQAKMQRKVDSLNRVNHGLNEALSLAPFTRSQYRRMDSLEYENADMKRQLSILNQSEGVNQLRIRDLEEREAEVRDAHFKIEIQKQLMRDRENDLKMRIADIEAQELKYQGLEEKEKRLKMIEQKLRQAVLEDAGS